jgi:group I intron endonuclease
MNFDNFKMKTYNLDYLDRNLNLDEKDKVKGVIYIMKCITNSKCYVGQTLTHIMNHGKYRVAGSNKRFKQHLSEAINNKKKKQCYALNNAIRKYGADKFIVKTLCICDKSELNNKEIMYIKIFNTRCPDGYNIHEGGNKCEIVEETRKKISQKTKDYYHQKRLEKFKDVKIDDGITQYIFPKDRSRPTKYTRVRIPHNGKILQAHFGGNHITKEEGYQMAIDFLNELKSLQI